MIPNTYYYTLPIVVLFFFVELIYSWKEQRHLYSPKGTFSNILMGIGYFISNSATRLIMFYCFQLVYKCHLLNLKDCWWVWILAFLGNELSYYWFHRASHEINWFWASHAVHHSSEEFNLSVSFRLSWTSIIGGQFLFWLWMPLLGFSPWMVLVSYQICMFYQSFLHTETVGKLPAIIEYIFNTPSHHRVHHSSNPDYLDKNHGAILILLDRVFGTYCEEKEKPYYGLTKKINSYDPLVIAFHEWNDLFSKAAHAGSIKNSINYFIQAPGWSHDGNIQTVKELRRSTDVILSPVAHSS